MIITQDYNRKSEIHVGTRILLKGFIAYMEHINMHFFSSVYQRKLLRVRKKRIIYESVEDL